MIKKRGIFLILILIIVINSLNSFALLKESISKDKAIHAVTEGDTLKETANQISGTNVKSFSTPTELVSGASSVNYNKQTGDISIKKADVLILKDLDAVQLQDARLRNRVLTMQSAGSVHLKDPIPIDLDEIGPSTFWFEGNDLRAMEITFPKDKSYTLNNHLSHDSSKFFDIEHMLDSDKDGITDEVERLRNLNPFSKDTDNDGLDDNTELL